MDKIYVVRFPTLIVAGITPGDTDLNAQVLVRFEEKSPGGSRMDAEVSHFTLEELRDPKRCPVWWDDSVTWFAGTSYGRDRRATTPNVWKISRDELYGRLVSAESCDTLFGGSRISPSWDNPRAYYVNHWLSKVEIHVSIVINLKDKSLLCW